MKTFFSFALTAALASAVSLDTSSCALDCNAGKYPDCGAPGSGLLLTNSDGTLVSQFTQNDQQDDILEDQRVCAQFANKNNRSDNECTKGALFHKTNLSGSFCACISDKDFGSADQQENGKSKECSYTCVRESTRPVALADAG